MQADDEQEMRRRIFEELIAEVEAAIRQHERTLEGLRQRIEAEFRRREWLLQKRAELTNDQHRESDRSVADWIVKALLEIDKPMHVREIVKTLESNGIQSKAENGLMNSVMSALSRRSDLFQRVERGHYALREQTGNNHSINRRHRKLEPVGV